MKETCYHINTSDGATIALWKLSGATESEQHVLLTHGTFSNRKVCDGIASYLVDLGHTCWSLEWRNHGNSPPTSEKFNLETIGLYDMSAAFDFLLNQQNVKRLSCIAHSGGGIAITIMMIRHPEYRIKVNSVVFFAVQAFAAGTQPWNRFKILLGKYYSALLGYVPAKSARSSGNNESYYTMKQWFNWNLQQNFLGNDGFDYLPKMKNLKMPILSICGKNDTFIAPKIGCEKFLYAFGSDKKQLLYLSKANGNLEDYNHGRLIKSRNSKAEIWPIVAAWIERYEK